MFFSPQFSLYPSLPFFPFVRIPVYSVLFPSGTFYFLLACIYLANWLNICYSILSFLLYLPTYLSTDSSTYLSIYRFMYLPTYLPIYLPTYLSTDLSTYLFICLLYVCLPRSSPFLPLSFARFLPSFLPLFYSLPSLPCGRRPGTPSSVSFRALPCGKSCAWSQGKRRFWY